MRTAIQITLILAVACLCACTTLEDASKIDPNYIGYVWPAQAQAIREAKRKREEVKSAREEARREWKDVGNQLRAHYKTLTNQKLKQTHSTLTSLLTEEESRSADFETLFHKPNKTDRDFEVMAIINAKQITKEELDRRELMKKREAFRILQEQGKKARIDEEEREENQ